VRVVGVSVAGVCALGAGVLAGAGVCVEVFLFCAKL
jgi:hypothetical protein